MIIFEKIRFKNFLSYGNNFTEINLIDKKLNLIIGKNGQGKSSINCALCFALYGKPYRKVTKNQLLNSINKSGLVVEIEFSTNGKSYKVSRGIKPNIFEIYENGILLNQDSKSKDYQEYLENQILKIQYKSFIQVIILSTARYSSFMDLSALDRRNVIEDILDIQIFSSMNQVVKDKLTEIKTSIQTQQNAINLIKTELAVHKKHAQEQEHFTEEKLNHIKSEIESYIEANKSLEEENINLSKQLKTIDIKPLESKLRKLLDTNAKINSNIERIKADLKFFSDHDTCSVCKQDIDIAHKTDIIGTNENRMSELLAGKEKLKLERTKVESELKILNKESAFINDINNTIRLNNNTISNNNNYISKLNIELTTTPKDIDKGDIKKLLSDLETKTSIYEDLIETKRYYDYTAMILKDGGVKTHIIKKYLPILNKYINSYLEKMDFFVNFNIDENFNEVIKSRHRDEFKIDSFSEGEKMRINIALLFAFNQLAKIKNSINTNIRFFDEILDSSADDEAVQSFLSIIQESEFNTFVISHRTDSIIDKFDKVFKADKVKNFSRLLEV